MVQELLSAGADVNGCTASLPGIVDVDDSPDLVEGTSTAEDVGKGKAGASELPDMPAGDDAQAAAVKIQVRVNFSSFSFNSLALLALSHSSS